MEKQYKCSKCSKELANRHSLSRHKKKFCKERNSQSYDSVDQPSRCLTAGRDLTSDSYSPAIDAGKENNQIQSRYSQFASHFTNTRKAIADAPEKIQRKDLVENNTGDERQHYSDTLDSSKVVTGENGDDENEDEDFDQLFSKKKIAKTITNKWAQLLYETERGERQNRRTLIILLDILKDCRLLTDNEYEECYDDIENV